MQPTYINPDKLKQLVVISLIILLGILIIWQLYYFLPGFLGAIALYVCFRKYFFYLSIIRRKKKWLSATLIILIVIGCLILPVTGLIFLIIPKITYGLNHTDELIHHLNDLKAIIEKYIPSFKFTDEQIQQVVAKSTVVISAMFNATASVLANTLIALFFLYFMLMDGRKIEKRITNAMPLKDKNKETLWNETRNMILSNAVGIPLLIIGQCIVAIVGYWIFGVNQFIFWGVLTGIASIIPVVGCMVIYIPICIILIASGQVGMGIGLLIYSIIVISNIDNVLRFTLMKRIGDVHPVITVFGVILGLQIFGIMGLIFGPLLLAYFALLLKIYNREFNTPQVYKFLPPKDTTSI